jgi:transposase
MHAATIKKWAKRFREWRLSTDDVRDGRPRSARSAINRKKVETLVKEDKRRTTRTICCRE